MFVREIQILIFPTKLELNSGKEQVSSDKLRSKNSRGLGFDIDSRFLRLRMGGMWCGGVHCPFETLGYAYTIKFGDRDRKWG